MSVARTAARSGKSERPPRTRASGSNPRSSAWRITRAAAALLVLVVLALTVDVGDALARAQDWVSGLGGWAPAAFVALYVLVTLLGGPGMPFTLASPVLFGPAGAFIIMVIASSLSAALAFLIARHAARGVLERRVAGNETFSRVVRLIDRHAWIIIPFLRIVPCPFALNNYGFGLTPIRFWRYLLLTEVGMVPMNALFVFGAGSILGAASGPTPWPLAALAAGAAVVAVALGIAGRRVWAEAAIRSDG